MSTLDLTDVTPYGETEELAITAYAKKWGIRRMYKVANDFGDKVTHTNFFSVKTPQEEFGLFSSPYVHNIVLVFDDGEHVCQPVTFNDTNEGRQVLGIALLGKK